MEAAQAEAWTNAAASGWGGDTYQLYRKGASEAVVILATLWDTTQDAQEFEAELKPAASRLMVRKDRAVVVVAGGNGATAVRLAQGALLFVAPARVAPRRATQ
jgi:hypothetical protein